MLILIKDTQIGLMYVVNHLYIFKKGLLKRQTPQFITTASEKIFSSATKNPWNTKGSDDTTRLNTECPKMVKHTIKILQQML